VPGLHRPIVAAFSILPGSLVELLLRGGDRLRVSHAECEVLKFEGMETPPKFSFVDSTDFADGLRPIESLFPPNEQPSLAYLSPELQTLVADTAQCLRETAEDCVLLFVEGLSQTLITTPPDVYHDLAGVFVGLLSRLRLPALFPIMFDFFTRDTVLFDPRHSVFCRGRCTRSSRFCARKFLASSPTGRPAPSSGCCRRLSRSRCCASK
jgi:hypothetical protein